jgi:hypothetical protein
LIPGFIVSGAGVGLINPPLASTAIGVVTPDRAGMASGINSTFRQVGIATGIAGLGTLFAHTVSTHIETALRGTPGVSSAGAHALARTVSEGSGAASGLGAIPARARPAAVHAVRASFTTGLNEVFLVGALLALVSAVLTLLLIRSKDFESGAARASAAPKPSAERSQPSAQEAPPARAQPREVPVEPEPVAPAPTGTQLLRGAEAVIAASGEAARDYERQVEHEIERHRAAELARAEAQSRALLSEAMERNDRYAQSLRRRLAELGGERERLVAELRKRTDSVLRHADEATVTRARLYRVIGELGSFEAERATPPANEESANGAGPNGDRSVAEAPARSQPAPEA